MARRHWLLLEAERGIGRRVWLLTSFILIGQAFIVWSEKRSTGWDDLEISSERWMIGLPWSPWYERTWDTYGRCAGGHQHLRFVSLSCGLFCVGAVMLWGAWYTKDFVAELEAEKRANASNPPPASV